MGLPANGKRGRGAFWALTVWGTVCLGGTDDGLTAGSRTVCVLVVNGNNAVTEQKSRSLALVASWQGAAALLHSYCKTTRTSPIEYCLLASVH